MGWHLVDIRSRGSAGLDPPQPSLLGCTPLFLYVKPPQGFGVYRLALNVHLPGWTREGPRS